jgi:mono/diheme cytochrome c family protein
VLSSAAEYADLEMPESVANDPDRVAKGQRLAQVNCQACHGAGLRGDGPVVQFLGGKGPVPADLIGGAASSATDGQVFAWVSYGGQAGLATAMLGLPTPSWMPQFAYLLTEEERWEVVAYLRSAQGR